MHVLAYTVRIEPAEEGGYDVFVPALPGCVTQGDTYEEAVAIAQEAIEGFVEALALVGEPVPIEMNPAPIAPRKAISRDLRSAVASAAPGRWLTPEAKRPPLNRAIRS